MSHRQEIHATSTTNFEGGQNSGTQIGQLITPSTESYQQKVLKWLSPLNFNQKQEDVFAQNVEGTCQWFLDTEKYERWENGKSAILWCHGIHGSGKTVLVSTIVDHLHQKFSKSKSVGIACIYCQYKEKEIQSPRNLFASLWRQLYDSDTTLPVDVQELYDRHTKMNTGATLDEVILILKAQISRLSAVYLFIDALDECPEDGRARQILTQRLQDLLGLEGQKESTIRLLVTSRSAISLFTASEIIEIKATEDDIVRFVSHSFIQGISQYEQVSDSVRKNQALRQSIINMILKKSDKMFLMARLYLDSLQTKVSTRELRDALRGLPAELGDVYHEAWSRVTNQGESARHLATKALRWLVFSFQQLSVKEFSHAIAVCSGDVFLDKERLVSKEILLGACQGLVAFDEASSIVRLTHYTTQEYFEKNKVRYFSNPHDDLAATCLTYLNFRAFAGGPCKFLGSSAWHLRGQKGAIKKSNFLPERCRSYPLPNYASSHWGNHVRHSSGGANQQALLKLFQAPKALAASLQARSQTEEQPVNKDLPQELGVLVLFGLTELLRRSFDEGYPIHVDAQSTDMKIMLQEAARLGRHEIVDITLENGVTVTVEEALPLNNLAILDHAIAANLEITEKALLAGINQNNSRIIIMYIDMGHKASKIRQRATQVLIQSIKCDKPEMVEIAIQEKADVNYRDEYGYTPLEDAVRLGHIAEVMLLIKKGADVNAVNSRGQTMAMVAASQGYASILKIFLKFADFNSSRDSRGWSLLGTAVASQSLAHRRLSWILSLGKGHDFVPSRRNDEEQRPKSMQGTRLSVEDRMSLAISEVANLRDLPLHRDFMDALHEDGVQQHIITLLLEEGADIKSVTLAGESLLHLAIVSGQRLKSLLKAADGALDINAQDFRGRTPLHYALAAGSAPGMLILLRYGADINARDSSGATALHFSVHSKICLSKMIESRLDLNTTDKPGRTAIHYAALSGATDDRLDQLRRAGADDSILDCYGLKATDYGGFHDDPRDFDHMGLWFEEMQTRNALQVESILCSLDNSMIRASRVDFNPGRLLEEFYEKSKEWWLVSDDEASDEESSGDSIKEEIAV